MKMGKKRRKVKIKRRNWDVDFYNDIITGNGFQITEPADVSLDGIKKKTLYGPRSPLYGTTYSDEQAFIERYSCECGEFKGKEFEGEICPFCQKEVKSVGSNVKVTGWISLGNHRIINPYYYQLLKSALGKMVFPEIITLRQKVDTDGHTSRATVNDYDSDRAPLSPFAGIGLEGFLENFDTIMDYFKSVKKNKAAHIAQLQREKRSVFTSHIPVYSTMLRPQSITSDSFYYNGIDKQVNPIFNLSENLKDATDIERPMILQRIQTRVNKMWDYNFELINGKEGWIRDQLLGGSLEVKLGELYKPL